MPDFKQEFDKIVSQANQVLLVTHNDPDGDAIGSILSMYGYLQENFSNKAVQMMISTPINQRFRSFANFEKIQSVEDVADHLQNFDLAIFLDANYAVRFTKKPEQFLAFQGQRVAIDHHPDKGENYILKHIDTEAASTSELLYFLLFEGQAKISPAICETLMMGLLSDTGNFSYVTHDSLNVFDMAKRLVKDGNINIEALSARYSGCSQRTFTVLQQFMANAKFEEVPGWPKFIYTYITAQFIKDGGYTNLETEEASDIFTGYLKSITEASWGFIVRNYDDKVKVSLRSRTGSVNVQAVAEGMGKGSGHIHSSGAKFLDPTGQPVDVLKVIEEIKDWLGKNAAQLSD